MVKVAVRVLTIAALATLATSLLGEEDFPLVGTYTENQACKRDGSGLRGIAREDHGSRHRFGVRPLHHPEPEA